MRRASTLWLTTALLLVAASACAQEDGTAADDTTAFAPSLDEMLNLRAEADADTTTSTGFLKSWSRIPKASFKAGMQKVGYSSDLSNMMILGDNSTLSQQLRIALDDYRAQEKTSEKRSASFNYATDSQKALVGSLNLSDNWSKDEVTNSAGNTSINKRDARRASASLKRDGFSLAGTSHDVAVNGVVNQQLAEQLNQRNDISEASLDGALRSGYQARDWLSMHTGLYASSQSGERSLGEQTNPSSSGVDSLRAGVFYQRRFADGGVTIARSSFEKRYLDYRRNANGIIDTIGAAEKIVQELERDDAVTMAWSNELRIWGLNLTTKLARDFSENTFRASGVGIRERHQDTVDLRLGYRLSRLDTINVSYGYQNKWDDQTYKGATASRGRQVSQRQDMNMVLVHALFTNTDLRFNFQTGLSQDTAEGGFNANDRDRLETSLTMKMDTLWPNGVKVNLSFDARRIEDISIRSERSSNNNVKDTFEIAPSYFWPLADWINLTQSFRVWIQYTDYVYSEWENVDKQDDYNKRGNLNTKVTVKPNARLSLTVKHDLNIKSNAKLSRTDIAGRDFYNKESDQTVSNIDFAMSYRISDWFSLQGTTNRKKDTKETYGDRSSLTDRYSGQVAIGGEIDKKLGSGKSLKIAARKFFADGPSVQDINRAYWDVDVQFSWRF
ncbi:hypothetical protein H8E07_03505 [bacterium]|nr:hypothetical protein [bacterium]